MSRLLVVLLSLALLGVNAVPDLEEFIKSFGYPAETHHVTTDDGYILTVHRIPQGVSGASGKGSILVNHGIMSSSGDFVNAGPGKSLGFVLADAGYDVWLTNARGNCYSMNHTHLNPLVDTAAFFNFSWHEVGSIDLPNTIDYILETTSEEKIFYSGHSQGGTVFYVMGSVRPEYNQKIRLAALLAPSAMLDHTSPSLKLISQFIYPLEQMAKNLTLYHVPLLDEIHTMASAMCGLPELALLCEAGYIMINSYPDPLQPVNAALVSKIFSTTPSDFPLKSLFHYGQVIKEGKFQQYNYGSEGNLIHYGAENPPEYDLTAVTANVAIYYGANDLFVRQQDVATVMSLLPNATEHLNAYPTFSHIDILYAPDVVELLYKDVLANLDKF